jgi:PIN domain nuclease of toxin-antitoxin system
MISQLLDTNSIVWISAKQLDISRFSHNLFFHPIAFIELASIKKKNTVKTPKKPEEKRQYKFWKSFNLKNCYETLLEMGIKELPCQVDQFFPLAEMIYPPVKYDGSWHTDTIDRAYVSICISNYLELVTSDELIQRYPEFIPEFRVFPIDRPKDAV